MAGRLEVHAVEREKELVSLYFADVIRGRGRGGAGGKGELSLLGCRGGLEP